MLRWLTTIVLLALFLGLVAFNWRGFWRNTVRGGGDPNPVPLVAGLVGIVVVFVCPIAGSADLWWVPVVVDFGSAPYAVWLGYAASFGRS